jgi:hypothetical protein
VGRNLADVAALDDGGTAWKQRRRKVGERTAAGGRKKIARDCIIGDGAMVLMQLVGGQEGGGRGTAKVQQPYSARVRSL